MYLLLVAAGLALRLHYIAAILAAQALTVACAFPAYRYWVFAPGGRWGRDLRRFLSVWSSGAVAGLVMTPLLVEFAGLPPMGAQVIALAVVAGGSYLGHRLFTFHAVSPNGAQIPGQRPY